MTLCGGDCRLFPFGDRGEVVTDSRLDDELTTTGKLGGGVELDLSTWSDSTETDLARSPPLMLDNLESLLSERTVTWDSGGLLRSMTTEGKDGYE